MITTTSITDLKKNTASIIRKVQTEGNSIMILQRSQAAAVLVDPKYLAMLESLAEDMEDIKAFKERANEPKVSLESVKKALNS